MGLDIIDILRVVGEELALVLQQGDEGMSRRETLGLGQDVFGNGEEDGRVLLKDLDIEDLLGVVQAQVRELRVQTRAGGAEIGNAQGGGDAGAGEDDDVLGLLEQLDGVVDRVVLRQLGPLCKLPADSQDQEAPIGLIFLTFEAIGRAHSESSKKLLGGDDASINSAADKLLGAQNAKLVAVADGLVRSAELGVWGDEQLANEFRLDEAATYRPCVPPRSRPLAYPAAATPSPKSRPCLRRARGDHWQGEPRPAGCPP